MMVNIINVKVQQQVGFCKILVVNIIQNKMLMATNYLGLLNCSKITNHNTVIQLITTLVIWFSTIEHM